MAFVLHTSLVILCTIKGSHEFDLVGFFCPLWNVVLPHYNGLWIVISVFIMHKYRRKTSHQNTLLWNLWNTHMTWLAYKREFYPQTNWSAGVLTRETRPKDKFFMSEEWWAFQYIGAQTSMQYPFAHSYVFFPIWCGLVAALRTLLNRWKQQWEIIRFFCTKVIMKA